MNTQHKVKKVVAYVRVSTKEQKTTIQEAAIKEYCGYHGYTLVNIYKDIGISGASQNRAAYQELIKDIQDKRKPFEAVVIWKLDRLGRTIGELLRVNELMEKNNIGFMCVTHPIDTTHPTGKLYFTMLGAFAEFERSIISERIAAGKLRSDKQQGRKFKDISEKVVMELHGQHYSMRHISKKLKVSFGTIRNTILRVKIRKLEQEGKNIEQIAEVLNTTKKTVKDNAFILRRQTKEQERKKTSV